MMGDLPKVAIGLVMILLVSVIGLGIAQQAIDTVTFESTDDFCATKDTVVSMVDDAFGWINSRVVVFNMGLICSIVLMLFVPQADANSGHDRRHRYRVYRAVYGVDEYLTCPQSPKTGEGNTPVWTPHPKRHSFSPFRAPLYAPT